MITLKQESVLLKKLKSLTELELISVLQEFSDHIRKKNLSDAVQQALDVDDLRSELKSLERDIEDLEEDKEELESRMQHAISILEDIENLDDDVEKLIKKAIRELDV